MISSYFDFFIFPSVSNRSKISFFVVIRMRIVVVVAVIVVVVGVVDAVFSASALAWLLLLSLLKNLEFFPQFLLLGCQDFSSRSH